MAASGSYTCVCVCACVHNNPSLEFFAFLLFVLIDRTLDIFCMYLLCIYRMQLITTLSLYYSSCVYSCAHVSL